METLMKIQNILLVSNKISNRQATILAINILAVNEGWKVGFIWDIGPPITFIQIKHILSQLKLQNVINKEMQLICIKGDCCILNRKSFSESIQIPVFIDVTYSLIKPKLILQNDKKIHSLLQNVQTQIFRSASSEVLQLTIDPLNYCVPTILGLLAGYPIIYWYDSSNNDSHCINGIELIVYKVTRDAKCIYSFSCPKMLHEIEGIKSKIKIWKNKLKCFACEVEILHSETNCIVNL